MADDIPVTPGSGASVSAADTTLLNGGAVATKVQRTRPGFGTGATHRDTDTTFPFPVQQWDPETGLSLAFDSLRRQIVVNPYTVLADSVINGFNAWWVTTLASGGTATVTAGEGVLNTSASGTGSVQMQSPLVPYHPGQVHWFNSAFRLGDTGIAGNIRRWGYYTFNGSGVPQDGFAYELNGTTLNIVCYKNGTATFTVAVGSWSLFATAPFTLDTSYHQWEIQTTANSAYFYVDKKLRHIQSGGATPLTGLLDLPMSIQNINTTATTSPVIAVRNLGIGRLGQIPVRLAGPSVINRSGTITTGGTAQTLAAAYVERAGMTVQNISSGILTLTEDGVTTASTTVGYRLNPGDTATINTQKLISIWGATTGQAFQATEW